MDQVKRKIRLSKISTLHYVKLVYRSALFLGALVIYLMDRIRGGGPWEDIPQVHPVLLALIWIVYAVEMLARFFPSSLESMGCQKQFARNYLPTAESESLKGKIPKERGVAAEAVAWVALNGAIGGLYAARVIDVGILLLVSLAYGICDMVCILFFCPFQTWFMKNKCCGTCRIYNWDFAMMFTPLLFVPRLYTWSLLAMGLLLLIKWEYIHSRYPERFYERTNANLSCANCPEKLCHHKKQLRRFSAQRLQALKGKEKVL